MLIRLVKMHFTPAFVAEFKETFKTVQPRIAAFKGCSAVQLLQDNTNPNVFFTISHWADEQHLEDYRQSLLFRETWALVKPNFQSKAEAWSLLSP